MAIDVKNISKLKETFANVRKAISHVIVGQEEVVEQILVALLCDGNALLESLPGLGKTLTIKTLSKVLDLKFARIQCTPDLMPSDITGTYVIDDVKGKKVFNFQKGPIFANMILVDEINRATPKTQSALLEAMQEKQVTTGNETFQLDKPFFVLATQNPIDQEGTYPLPEAQTDRFLLKIIVNYPPIHDELEIVNRYTGAKQQTAIHPLLKAQSLVLLQTLTKQVPIADDLKNKVVTLVNKTRTNPEFIEFGASPRASIGLIMAAKAHALLSGRKFVSAKDIEDMALPVLRHRIVLSFKAQKEGMTPDDVIKALL